MKRLTAPEGSFGAGEAVLDFHYVTILGWRGQGFTTESPTEPKLGGAFKGKAGDGLLSRNLSIAVPSALQGLTAVFGMGTGVAPAR